MARFALLPARGAYGRHSLRFLGPQLWSKLSKEERNIGTLATLRTMINKKVNWTYAYLLIHLASELLIYEFSFYIVKLELSFKVLKSKFRT